VFTVGKTSGSWGNNKREKPEKGGAGTKSLEKVLRKHLGQELRGRDNEKGKGKKTRKRDTETDGKDRRERGTKGIGKRDGKEEWEEKGQGKQTRKTDKENRQGRKKNNRVRDEIDRWDSGE
jgi:hypothetical protein